MKLKEFNTSVLRLYSYFVAITLLIIGCKSGDSGTVEKIDHYGTGEVARKYTMINNKKEGLMTDYYPSGKLKGVRKFKNDIQVDTSTIYYESGARKEVQYFIDGKVNGGDTTFHENGKPHMALNFIKGIKDGYVRSWGEDGILTYEAKFKMDTIVEVKGQPILRDSLNHQVTQSPEALEKGIKDKLKK